MARKMSWGFAAALIVVLIAITSSAQETAVKGNLAGAVLDKSGAIIPNAKVTINGPTGTRTETTGTDGRFLFGVLSPGMYTVKVEKDGFKTSTLPNVEVATGRTTAVQLNLAPGQVTETVEVTAEAITVDPTSTALGTNLPDTFYEKVPVQRNVANLFYVAPGVADGGAAGAANPSISGGSGLENQYIADGVSITDAAFGGLGVFNRVYGSLATGINLSFIKEVQVKTGGYEPQYGKSTGGIVQIVTKSGSNEYHGSLSFFAAPKGLQSRFRNTDDPEFARFNRFGSLIHTGSYDFAGEIGGYVPGMRDRVFFFGSYNPSYGQRFLRAPDVSLLASRGDFNLRTVTNNYAAKLTFKLTDKNTLEGSVFGDPTHTSTGPFRRLRTDNATSFSKLEYGTRQVALRLNSTLSPTWLFNASGTWGRNTFDESNFANVNEITDETQAQGLPGQRGTFLPAGRGFVEPTESNTYGLTFDTQKIVRALGEHSFYIGYHMDRPFYQGERLRSGPTFTTPFDPNNTSLAGLEDAAGQPASAQWRLRTASPLDPNADPRTLTCTLCPLLNVPGYGLVPVYLQILRSEWGLNTSRSGRTFNTNGRYHAAYANDSWAINRHVTVNLGLRWEQQRLTGESASYTFTDNWSPRVGFSIDPTGNRKTKFFGNFGRYNYAIPLDMAERALTNELDLFGLRVAPAFTTDAAGNRIAIIDPNTNTVIPVVDPTHVLNGVAGGIRRGAAVSSVSTTAIASGTRMSYLDEYVVGLEHEFPMGIVGSVKYLKRDLKRIVEDTGGISPEAALAGVTQVFQIANVSAGTDLFANPIGHTFAPGGTPPASCSEDFVLDPVTDNFGNELGAICFEPLAANGADPGDTVPDGIPDGFTNARRTYWAVETEVNKAFSNNWLMRVNYRFARLYGNFEGALRNDNGQTDPSISSLFDFTPGVFNLLGDQFRAGPLNTDRKHIVNTYISYAVPKGPFKNLGLGMGFRLQTGTPINDLKAHPVYENPGEVPFGGRGRLGRTPTTHTFDLHADYTVPTSEKTRLVISTDMFNLTNRRQVLFFDQNEDINFGTRNVDFLKPLNQARIGDAFQAPFNARFALKFVF